VVQVFWPSTASGGTGNDEAARAASRESIHLNSRQSIRFLREPYELPGGVVEMLRYSLDVFDANDNLIEVGNLVDSAPGPPHSGAVMT